MGNVVFPKIWPQWFSIIFCQAPPWGQKYFHPPPPLYELLPPSEWRLTPHQGAPPHYLRSTAQIQTPIQFQRTFTHICDIAARLWLSQVFSSLCCCFFFLPADAADEAVAVERPAQRRHHLSGDVLLTAVTLGPVEALVVLGADVLSTVVEETRVDQVTTAHWQNKTKQETQKNKIKVSNRG